MKRNILALLIIACSILPTHAGSRSSANYSITAETADFGGLRSSSANYTNDGSVGVISGLSNSTSGIFFNGSGYVAQLGDAAALPTPTATPTPGATIQISGTVFYCSKPVPGPVVGVTCTLTGGASLVTITDSSGSYAFGELPSGNNYVVTPSKAGLIPGSVGSGINTVDVVATQRHFLMLGIPLTGCRLTAADVNGLSGVNTIDVVAIQRFFLGLTTGIANVGKYQFNPTSRSYQAVVTDQSGQNYDTLVFGDVAPAFVH